MFKSVAALVLLTFSSSCAAPRFSASLSAAPKYDMTGVVTIGEIEPDKVEDIVKALAVAEVAHSPQLIFRIDSPGGDVETGLVLVDMMKTVERKGTTIVCVVDGLAASMAGYILQACTVRVMTRQSAILFHEPATQVQGNEHGLRRMADRLAELNHQLAIFIAGRMHISVKEYEERIHNHNWWVGWEEAVQLGAVDQVLESAPR